MNLHKTTIDGKEPTKKAWSIGFAGRSFWCMIGLHNWYYGSYSNPVWGRSERRCMDCPKKQYRTYKPLGWKSY